MRPLEAGMFDGLIVDNFAGGGGASLGLERALGRAVDIAINHDAASVEMHRANHPRTLHLCEDVWQVDPMEVTAGRPVELAWFSPDCKHFSRAKGGKPVEKKIRGLAWVAIRWAKRVRPRLIMLENVREFQDWGPLTAELRPDPDRKGTTFRRFVGTLKNMGYAVEWKTLNAADYGAPTNRRRLFLVARCDGEPIVWPESTHGPGHRRYRTAAECIDWSIPCPSIFDRKRPLAEKTLRRIAMGLRRYVLESPRPFIVKINHGGEEFRGQPLDQPLSTVTHHHGHAVVVPHLVAGYGEREGQPPRTSSVEAPLGAAVGTSKHAVVAAFLKQAYGGMVGKPLTDPVPVVTAKDHNWLAAASLIRTGQQSSPGGVQSAEAPLTTIVSKAEHCIAAAHLVKWRGDSKGNDLSDPLPTVTSGAGSKRPAGAAHAMGIAATYLTQFRGSNQGNGGSVEQPTPTQTAENRPGLVTAFLAKYYGNDDHGQAIDGPMHTVTAKDRLGLVTVELRDGQRGVVVKVEGLDYIIADIGLRMLTPRELARAQGFPDDYILTGSKANQVARIGNSVPPIMSEVLAGANVGGMGMAVSA